MAGPLDNGLQNTREFFGDLNVIRKLWTSNCGDKWSVLVETGAIGAGMTLWMLIVPSPRQILQQYLHPKAVRGRKRYGKGLRKSRHRRGRKLLRKITSPPLPDTDQLVAERIPGRDLFEGRRVGQLERWAWAGLDVVDRLQWYWLLLEAGPDFVHRWSSGIMHSQVCTTTFTCCVDASATHIEPQGNILWFAADQMHTSFRRNAHIADNGGVVVDETGRTTGTIALHAGIEVIQFASEGPDNEIYAAVEYVGSDNEFHRIEGSTVTVSEEGHYQIGVSGDVEGASVFQCTWAFEHSGDRFAVTHVSPSVQLFAELDREP